MHGLRLPSLYSRSTFESRSISHILLLAGASLLRHVKSKLEIEQMSKPRRQGSKRPGRLNDGPNSPVVRKAPTRKGPGRIVYVVNKGLEATKHDL